MKRLYIFLVIILATSASSALTAPDTFPYDTLITNEDANMLGTPNSWNMKAGAFYLQDISSEILPANMVGNSDNYHYVVPLDLGYNIIGFIQVDLLTELVHYHENVPYTIDESSTPPPAISESGLGDTWLKIRAAFEEEGGLFFTPRFAVKFNTGNEKQFLSDHQLDLDLSMTLSRDTDTNSFIGKSTVGMRYRFAKTVIDLTGEDKVTPGMMIYFDAMPGYVINKYFDIYATLFAISTMDEIRNGDSKEDTGASGIAVGARPRFHFNESTTLDGYFSYPVYSDDKGICSKELLIGMSLQIYAAL